MKIALFYGFELNTYMIICRRKANITHLSPKIDVKLLLYSSSKLVQIVDWKITIRKNKKQKRKRPKSNPLIFV